MRLPSRRALFLAVAHLCLPVFPAWIAGGSCDSGVTWLSNGEVTTEEAWETERFSLRFSSLLKKIH